MTTKVLKGTYSAGYTLQSPVTTLSIARIGYVEGNGVSTLPSATASYNVVNHGRVVADVAALAYGVYLAAGGTVTNGGGSDGVALISGYGGIKTMNDAGIVRNFGTVSGQKWGVFLGAGGAVTNGSKSDTSAQIFGGVAAALTPTAIVNFGTISGGRFGSGVDLDAGGVVTNGSTTDTLALIQGYGAVLMNNPAAKIRNFGTIDGMGTGRLNDYGIEANGGAIVNGSSKDTAALIEGGEGIVTFGGAVVVTNFGTIDGFTRDQLPGIAVSFGSAADVLMVEAGSAFLGLIKGGGGTLVLASGAGTISGLQDGTLTVSGSMAPTTFNSFGVVKIDPGAVFTASDSATVGKEKAIECAGTLSLATGADSGVVNSGRIETIKKGSLVIQGSLANSGTLIVDGGTLIVQGAVTGVGSVFVGAGILDFGSTFKQTVTFTGTKGELELARSQAYSGTITGFSTSGATKLDLGDIGFVGAGEATFSGTSTSGVLTVTDGTRSAHITLMGNYLASTFVASGDGHGGTVVVTQMAMAVPVPPHTFVSAMAQLGSLAGGTVHIGDASTIRESMLGVPQAMKA